MLTEGPIAWPDTFPAHPAPYSAVIVTTLDELLPTSGIFLDPMCGTGKCFELERDDRVIMGTEIEPTYAALHPRTLQADATALPFPTGMFDGGFCSPTYGNRMGVDYTAPGWTKNPKGRRNYSLSARWLARDARVVLHRNNTARYGTKRGLREYWRLHRLIWAEVGRVTRPGGIFLLNAKDLPKMAITDGHVELLTAAGFREVDRRRVYPPGYRNGANRDLRVDGEDVVTLVRER